MCLPRAHTQVRPYENVIYVVGWIPPRPSQAGDSLIHSQ